MDCPKGTTGEQDGSPGGRRPGSAQPAGAPAIELVGLVTDLESRRLLRAEGQDTPLRCVSSGYLGGERSCTARIPAGVVTSAWSRRQRAGAAGQGFFHFTWRGEVWLGFGLADGRVRGVYCPAHCAERDARSGEAAAADLDAGIAPRAVAAGG